MSVTKQEADVAVTHPVLQMYSQDHGWRGNIYVAAYSEEQARKFMSSDVEYVPSDPLEVEEIVAGWIGGHCAA